MKPSKRIEQIYYQMAKEAGVKKGDPIPFQVKAIAHFLAMEKYLDEQWEAAQPKRKKK